MAMPAMYNGKGITPPPKKSVNKAGHSSFETQRRCHQKSRTGVSVAPNMDKCPPIFFKKITSNE